MFCGFAEIATGLGTLTCPPNWIAGPWTGPDGKRSVRVIEIRQQAGRRIRVSDQRQAQHFLPGAQS